MSISLREENLGELPESVSVWKYDRSQVKTGVVHIGPSHFARGHVFKFFDDVLEHDNRWGVTAISLKSSDVRDALKDQDYLYSLTEQGTFSNNTRVIGSLQKVIVAQETPKIALNALTDPNVKLVTMTVTQKGYCHDPATGQLDFNRLDIKNCLSTMDEPSTAIGYLVAAIEKRKEQGSAPLTIMSCDNLPGNGVVLRNVVLAYAAQKSSELRQYIEENVSFPSTMVDRIVPSSSASDIFNSEQNGVGDRWPIYTERFFQWAIEDNFSGDMPDLQSVGANISEDVYPFELMKIRMLNGAHMALGCVGKLAGYDYVHDAMADDIVSSFVSGFMKETSRTLQPVGDIDFDVYQSSLVDRLMNPKMKDELVRLARNGTQKLNGRILDPLKDAIAQGGEVQYISFAVAAWTQYLRGSDVNGKTFNIMDEKAIESGLQDVALNSNGNPAPVATASQLFDTSLLGNKGFMESVTRHLHNIQEHGIQQAICNISDDMPLSNGVQQEMKYEKNS